MLWRCWLGGRKGIRPVKNWAVGCWHCYLSGARCSRIWPSWCHCHSLSLAPVKSRLVFTFLVPAHPGNPGQGAVKLVCVIEMLHAVALPSSHITICLLTGERRLPSVLCHCCLGISKSIWPEWWGVGAVICLERGTDCLHMVQWCHCIPKPHHLLPH